MKRISTKIIGNKQQKAITNSAAPKSLGSSRVLESSFSNSYQTTTLEFTGKVSFSTISKQ